MTAPEKATVERAFTTVKQALAPLLALTDRLAAAVPTLRRGTRTTSHRTPPRPASPASWRPPRIEAEYRDRSSLGRLGLAAKSRLLFVGPPGCGKTLCAEVLAGDLGLTLLYARFDGIVSSYLGETASNLRRLFNYARPH